MFCHRFLMLEMKNGLYVCYLYCVLLRSLDDGKSKANADSVYWPGKAIEWWIICTSFMEENLHC